MASPSRSTATTVQSPPSSRSSLSTDQPATVAARRNKSALRDYYKLADAATSQAIPTNDDLFLEDEGALPTSDFDQKDFDADKFVNVLLNEEGMHKILRVENRLVSDIRGLDGERKALVYDNYSKLIAATDTIKRMQSNMDPLAPTTETLKPAVGNIEAMSEELSLDLRATKGQLGSDEVKVERVSNEGKMHLMAQQQLVRWVLSSPKQLETFLKEDRREEAEKQWIEVNRLLEKWDGVPGVEAVRKKGVAIMNT